MCLYEAQISGEHLQDHWSSGLTVNSLNNKKKLLGTKKVIIKRANSSKTGVYMGINLLLL